MKQQNRILINLLVIAVLLLGACKKYLETKPNQALAVPTSLTDLQAMLDTYYKLNNTDPGAAETSADNYYLSDANWTSLSEPDQRLHTWQNDRVFSNYQNDWSRVYSTVFVTNVVLDKIATIERNAFNQSDWDNVKGSALLMRARAFLQAAIIWAAPYDPAKAATSLGIPLRMSSDFNEASTRGTLQQTYSQILQDLKEAADRLPLNPVHVIRPSQAAAFALLARTYLSMGNYDSCLLYADNCLKIKNTLLNYNSLNAGTAFPISQLNAEVIMENLMPTPSPLSSSRAKIDSTLYNSYGANDLRKTLFFKNNGNGSYAFRGSYEGGGNLFSGIATDEVYLMRAEANAKLGNLSPALADLNTLLQNRWKTGTYVPPSNPSANDLLQMIRNERRKELLMRGLRWMDLKRLNVEGANITLTRILNGQTYTLPPNDPRYAIAIPEEIIQLS
ncbi:MAG: RagB/SusD family nutrient uptake outer membrane protein, partial [Bacteroidota bacterium]|nr:RagB/SusD family nutrient uptake outer membrane protein [Bacteroidota bacterium]